MRSSLNPFKGSSKVAFQVHCDLDVSLGAIPQFDLKAVQLRTCQVGFGMAAWFDVMPSSIFAGADHQANLDLHGRWFSKLGRLPNAKSSGVLAVASNSLQVRKKKRNMEKH